MRKNTLLLLLSFVVAFSSEAQRRGFYYWDEFGQFFSPCDSFKVFERENSEISLFYFKRHVGLEDSLTLEGLYRFKRLGEGFYRVFYNRHRLHFRRAEYMKFNNCSVWDSDQYGRIDTLEQNPWKQTRLQGEGQEGMDSVVYRSTFFLSGKDTLWRRNFKVFYQGGEAVEIWTKEEQTGERDFTSGNYRIVKYRLDSFGRQCHECFKVDSFLRLNFLYRTCIEDSVNENGQIIEERRISYHAGRELPWVYLCRYTYRDGILKRVAYYYNGVLDELLIFEPYNKKAHGRRRRP